MWIRSKLMCNLVGVVQWKYMYACDKTRRQAPLIVHLGLSFSSFSIQIHQYLKLKAWVAIVVEV